MKEVVFETERTYVRRINHEDLQNFWELDSDPRVHTFLGNNPITEMSQAQKYIQIVLDHYETNGIGRLAIIEKTSGEFIGWTGIKYETMLRPKLAYYDVGYRLKYKFWGKGFATETGIASIKYGFEGLKLDRINGAADTNHYASKKVLEKMGLRQKEQFYYEETLCDFYEIKREDFTH